MWKVVGLLHILISAVQSGDSLCVSIIVWTFNAVIWLQGVLFANFVRLLEVSSLDTVSKVTEIEWIVFENHECQGSLEFNFIEVLMMIFVLF